MALLIANLDPAVQEDLLYRVFRDYGEIVSVKVNRNSQGRSLCSGQINFAQESQANDALQLNGTSILRRPLQVWLPGNNIFVYVKNRIANPEEYEIYQLLCDLVDIKSIKITKGKIQFQGHSIKIAIPTSQLHKIIACKIEYRQQIPIFEEEHIRKEREQCQIIFQNFSNPIQTELTGPQKFLIESIWERWMMKQFPIKRCVVELDKQPSACLLFKDQNSADEVYQITEQERGHPLLRYSLNKAIELAKSIDQQIDTSFLAELHELPLDPFRGQSKNFICFKYSQLEHDDRLLILQNIQAKANYEEIHQEMSKYGTIIKLTVKEPKKPYLNVKQCFIHYQTIKDSINCRCDIHQSKSPIFKNMIPKVTILLQGEQREEFKNLKR